MTTIIIHDPQTMKVERLHAFYTSTRGRTDIWLDTKKHPDAYNEEDTFVRLGLLNDDVQFDSHETFRTRLGGYLYGAIGKDVALVNIFDNGQDAEDFQTLLAEHGSKFTTTFDLTPDMTANLDANEVHDWLAGNVKHSAMIWRTEGDHLGEQTDYKNPLPNEELWWMTRWIDNEDTRIIGYYDSNEPSAFPALSVARLWHWPFEDYQVVRIMFTDPGEATRFKLTFGGHLVSKRNGIEPNVERVW